MKSERKTRLKVNNTMYKIVRMRLSLLTALLVATIRLQGADFEIRNETEFRQVVGPNAKLQKLADGFQFVEGPVWLEKSDRLIFSDIPSDELKQWTPAGGVRTYRKPSANANGNTVDRKGNLYSCEHTGRRVAIQDAKGAVSTLVDSYNGKKLNSPNDVVVKKDGTVWFTDPDYGIKPEQKEQLGNYVYRYDPKTREIYAVAKDFDKPNGLCFSPKQDLLYVADSGKPHHIRVFDINSDNTLSGGQVFCVIDNGGPDGIRCDEKGRVWSSAGDGVHIFATNGSLIGKILVPETPANLCFGGKGNETLFITARKSLYSIQVSAKGRSDKSFLDRLKIF